MKRKKRTTTSMEGWMMQNTPKGDAFYSDKLDRALTASASAHNRKIKTERLIVISGSLQNPIAAAITKVTLLNDPVVEETTKP